MPHLSDVQSRLAQPRITQTRLIRTRLIRTPIEKARPTQTGLNQAQGPIFAALLIALAAASSGCIFQNIGSTERLHDAVRGLNDELRWSRQDLATERVAAAYRPDFADKHRSWGRAIQIADTEYLAVQLSEDRDTAVSLISVSWYHLSTMTLRQTVVRQRWQRGGGTYVLSAEEVAEGDPALLVPPARPEPELDPEAEVIDGVAEGADVAPIRDTMAVAATD